MEKTWDPVVNPQKASLARPLFTSDAQNAADLAKMGNEEWFSFYYARAGIFVGDLDVVNAETLVDKARVEFSRTYSDVLQAAFALKGDW